MALVIAEAGENHCGNWEMARRLVDVAAQAGADYVKFQLYDARKVALDDPEREWFFRVQVPTETFSELAEYARKAGVAPLCTPWDAEMAEIIFSTGIKDIKIASFHIVNHDLLKHINKRARRVFVSTGMCSLDEIDAAVDLLNKVEELYLLHCVSEYPLEPERVNLRVMDHLHERYGKKAMIGYSDHTRGILAPIAAVARGAAVVEKHITLSKALEGTDHILSADPSELKQMVQQIREIERMLGDGRKRLTDLESQNQAFLRARFQHGS